MIETLVYDHSGTISDDIQLVLSSANNILNFFGRPQVSREQYTEDFGSDIVAVYKKWGVDASLEELNGIHGTFLKSQPRPNPIPFAVETVRGASKLVSKTVSFSAHPRDELITDLRNWGISDIFTAVYGGVRKYMDLDFVRMLDKTDSKPETTLYVGDTTVDIDLAKRNSVRCAVVINPKYCYQKPEKVRSHNPKADFYLENITELIPLLRDRNK